MRRLPANRQQAQNDDTPAAADTAVSTVATEATVDLEHGRALAWARAQLGRHEIPIGSNSGPFVRLCQRATWLPGTGWPWCVAFYMAAWRYGAKVTPWWLGAGAYAFLDAARKSGHAVSLVDAEPGDAVIFNLGAGHCAMLEEKYDGSGGVRTIDGNWANSVMRVEHPASEVRGCVCVTEVVQIGASPARPRMFEVATSASGERKVVYVSGTKAIARKLAALLKRFPRITITPRGGT